MIPTHEAEPVDRQRPPDPAPLRPFQLPTLHRRRLSNGVPLLVAPVRDLPVATFGILLEAGGITEPEGQRGVATLTASLLDTGAAGKSGEEIASHFEDLGLEVDATASWDATYLSLTGLAPQVNSGTEWLADLLRRPEFPLREFERLRAQRLAEIDQRRSEPGSLAAELAAHFIYSRESPYSLPLGGTSRSVSSLTRSDVEALHASGYIAPRCGRDRRRGHRGGGGAGGGGALVGRLGWRPDPARAGHRLPPQ